MKHQQFDQVLVAIRRIIRAIDQQSRKLLQSHGLTGPQALLIKEVGRGAPLTPGELANRVSLSQATITDIVKRLEGRGLLLRERSEQDKRSITIRLTQAGKELLKQPIPLLQEEFEQRFNALQDWEQSQLLSSVQRLAALMDANEIDASPVLASGSLRATPEAVASVVIESDDNNS